MVYLPLPMCKITGNEPPAPFLRGNVDTITRVIFKKNKKKLWPSSPLKLIVDCQV